MEDSNKIAKDICNCEYCRGNGTLLCNMSRGCIAYRTVLQLLYYKYNKHPSEELLNNLCVLFFDTQEYIKQDNPGAFTWIHKIIKNITRTAENVHDCEGIYN